jgi:endonuclease VIII
MHGSWHRYAPGSTWRRPPSRARLVLEVPGSVAVCFDAPVVELFEQRTEPLHPSLGRLGPDLLDPAFDATEALRRLRDPSGAATSIAEALLDQRVVAGIGNVYRSEVLWMERIDPFTPAGSLPDADIDRLLGTARRLLLANAAPGSGPARTTTGAGSRPAGERLWVYRRTGRPCRRCGTAIRSVRHGDELPRTLYWCPSCQGGG